MTQKRETYPVVVAGVRRDLPLFEVKPGLRIAVLNILGDVELTEAAAAALAERLKPTSPIWVRPCRRKPCPSPRGNPRPCTWTRRTVP